MLAMLQDMGPVQTADPWNTLLSDDTWRKPAGFSISAGMATAFVKMHGCGNDFVILDERARPARH